MVFAKASWDPCNQFPLFSFELREKICACVKQISSDLTFSTHIENVVAAATRMTGWVCRTFRRRSRTLMLTAWKSLIQSKLDYCSQLWSPSDQASISSLEGEASLSKDVLPREEKGEIPDNIYLEPLPGSCHWLPPPIPAECEERAAGLCPPNGYHICICSKEG